MASFPTSVYSPASKSAGQTITASFFNDPESEIVAIEQGYLNGTAPLNSSNSTVANLSVTGGSTFSSNVTLSTGTLTINQGQIKFPATQVASANANTLDDYEELTYTPADGSGAGLTFAVATGTYTKIGRMVSVTIDVTFPATADATAAQITLPFTAASVTTSQAGGGIITFTNVAATHNAYIASGGTSVLFFTNAGAAVANSVYSGKIVRLMCVYPASA